MENFRSQPGELYVNTFNIEKAISEVSNYTTREELSFEVNDALDAQGKAQNQANQYKGHEGRSTFDEVLLHGLVEAQDLAGLFNGLFCGNGWSHGS